MNVAKNSSAENSSRLLGIKTAAYRLGVSPRTVYSQLAKGTFPIKAKKHGRLWKILEHRLDAYIEE